MIQVKWAEPLDPVEAPRGFWIQATEIYDDATVVREPFFYVPPDGARELVKDK